MITFDNHEVEAKTMLKRSVLVIAAAATALGAHAADLALWEGPSMSAWTNSLSKKWTNPRVTADGLSVEAVAQDPQLYVKPPVPGPECPPGAPLA